MVAASGTVGVGLDRYGRPTVSPEVSGDVRSQSVTDVGSAFSPGPTSQRSFCIAPLLRRLLTQQHLPNCQNVESHLVYDVEIKSGSTK